MTDHLTQERRSWNMGRIKSKNTRPEILLRKELYSLGKRYRVNYNKLPGKPDIVFPSKKKAIFVHGCFWHRHDCKRSSTPKSNTDYWEEKFTRNITRDKKNQLLLNELGWSFIIVWECEIKNEFSKVTENILLFLG